MAFKKIEGTKIDGRKLPTYVWNADLIAFEGPIVSLYKTNKDSDALFIWVDSTEKRTRWAIVNISRDYLKGYLRKEFSLLDVFKQNEKMFVFDTTETGTKTAVMETTWNNFPPEYLPLQDSYLIDEISTREAKGLADTRTEKYEITLVGGELYIDDLGKIPRLYQQLYSFHYGLEHLDRLAVRSALSRLMNKWKGGINAVNLFSGLKSVTPSIHRAKLDNLQYASPGHIKMELLPELASRIESTATKAQENSENLRTLYKETYNFFSKNKISGFDDERSGQVIALNKLQEEELQKLVKKFFLLLGWNDYHEKFSSVDMTALAEARAVLAYYRRLRNLLEFSESNLIKLTKTN